MPVVALVIGLLWTTPVAAETPFAGLWQEPMTTTSRNDRAIWLAWYPQGVSESGQWETSSFLRFGCRISLPEQEDRIPSTDLRVTLYIERGEDEPSVPLWISPLYWIRGLSGNEYELVDIDVSIDDEDPVAALLRIRRTDYSVSRPEHDLEELPARKLLEKLVGGKGLLKLQLTGDERVPGQLLFDRKDTSVKAARAMLEHCPGE